MQIHHWNVGANARHMILKCSFDWLKPSTNAEAPERLALAAAEVLGRPLAKVVICGLYVQMYEPTSGTVKQAGTILQQAGAPGVLFPAPSSVAAAGQYVSMVSCSISQSLSESETTV